MKAIVNLAHNTRSIKSKNNISFIKSNHLLSGHKIKLDGVKTGSSSYYAGQSSYVPSHAIDRNLATFFASGKEYSTFPYWWMELNSLNINKVVVLKRSGLSKIYNIYREYTSSTMSVCLSLCLSIANRHTQCLPIETLHYLPTSILIISDIHKK